MAAKSTFDVMCTVALMLLFADFTTSATRCSDCGSTQVPYPLSTGPGCGDQSYRVRCDTGAGALFFDTPNTTYPIYSISPTIQRFRIRPPNFLNNNATCVTTDVSTEGLQLDPTLPFNITSGNTIMYLNCSESLLRSPLNCTSTSLCHSYINNSAEASVCGRSPICCTFRSGGSSTMYSIRVRDGGCQAYRSFVNLDYSLPVSRWPVPGVEIQWASPPEPLCGTQADCDASSTCVPSAAGGVRRCICNSGFHWDAIAGVCALDDTCDTRGDCDDSNRTALIAGLTSGLGAALVAAVIGFLLYRRHRRHKEAQARLAREREEILNAGSGKTAKVFTGKEIKKATNNFSKDRLLGTGGFGEVYKGILEDSTVVAVKCAKVGNAKGTDQVLNEVRILCQVNHRGLVRLLGCCVELEQPLLVYEYIPNGTLLEHLKGQYSTGGLSWTHRLNIARDTAEGLAYLHFSAVPPIYHRDVKSSNILLDEKMNAKVADFGLSRLAQADLSHVTTCAQGTLGYLDPEYYRNYQLTDKSDVYSFGVVLLELLTSEKAIDFNRPPDDVNLAIYVKRIVEEERLLDAVDPNLKKGASKLELETMKALGFLAVGCLEERRQNRPSMKEVTEEIEYIISIATSSNMED
ncbi:wall-associated receptor kinase-like 20 [Cynara cardunculus var. scolymus]|uniref:wall-associated receptor kinase-like 20 n=1 Tax=Cynara cardunculus var. scolymus TaxID=59895 RepID=UPI000D62C7B8|nr:wall-associated receptor kinase-like 20 [Cynara cardunculus var. scolymus]